MRALLAFFAVLLLLGFWPQGNLALGADYPRLRPNSCFFGSSGENGYVQEVELFLLEEHYFVLRQTFRKKTRSFTRHLTGHWRQLEGGAVLSLTNNYGLDLSLRVGGALTLYGLFPKLAENKRPLLTLEPKAFNWPTFTLMGELKTLPPSGRLLDQATGRSFALSGSPLRQLAKNQEYFVDAEVRLLGSQLELVRLRSFSLDFPNKFGETSKLPFDRLVAGQTWWITFPSGLTVSCVFAEKNQDQGTLEMSGQGLFLLVPYQVKGKELRFALNAKDAKMLVLCEAYEVLDLLQKTRTWAQDGHLVILGDGEKELAFLENAAQRSRFEPGARGTRR